MIVLEEHPAADVALIDAASGASLTYGELDARLAELGTAIGDRKQLVFVLCRSDGFTATAYLAALEGGHAVALVDASMGADRLASLLDEYAPEWVAGPPGSADRLGAAGVRVRDAQPLDDGELVELEARLATPIHPDLALLLSTSGSTGSSKFVRLSAANVRSNAAAIRDYLGLDRSERPITSLPLHYTFGLSVLNSHLAAGSTLVLSGESVMQRGFWQTFEELGCTSLAGVPYTYQMLERVGFRQMELPTLRTMQQAGGALDQRLTEHYAEHMAERGGRFFVMYGQTEATARMAYVPPERLQEKLGSAGIAIPGGRFRIEPGEGERLDGARIGEVVYAGPNVMLGYATGRGDLALGDQLDGELHTGDIGYLDEDGYLFLVGRSKRIAKVFGLRVNLDEVELQLRVHGPAAVVSGDDAIWAFCAFGTDASVEESGRALARQLRIHPSALRMRRVEDIPTSSSGKVDYQQVGTWTLT